MAIIYHPTHHMYMTDDDLEENWVSRKNHLSPSARPPDPNTGSATEVPDLSVPITIWRSESPIEKCQESNVIKDIKRKEKEQDEEEMVDEKANLKKKAKGKLTKKKTPVKSESSPADLSQSVRGPVRTPESSPESPGGLESEYSCERGKERPSSEDVVESLSPRKKEKTSSGQGGCPGWVVSQREEGRWLARTRAARRRGAGGAAAGGAQSPGRRGRRGRRGRGGRPR